MTRLLLATAAVVAISAPAMADNYNNNSPFASALTGAYIGAMGGYTYVDADVPGGDVNLDGGDYGVFVGYKLDQYLQNTIGVNGAIEAHYAWSGADDDGLEKDNEWGVSFRPGMSIISNTLNLETVPYAILGYKRAEIETPAGDNWHDGFELGLGTELVAWDHMSTRLEYSHTFYEEKGGIDPDDDSIRLGLGYRF